MSHSSTTQYIAKLRLYHTGTGKYVEANQTTTLAHLDADAVQKLFDKGAIELAPAAAPTAQPRAK